MNTKIKKEEMVKNSNPPQNGNKRSVVDSKILELNNRIKDVQSKLTDWYGEYEQSSFNVDYSERTKLENELNYLSDSKRKLYEFIINMISKKRYE